jgi:hypothetical protein
MRSRSRRPRRLERDPARLVGLPADYYAGDGNKTVILISNVRDDNYYDTNNAHALSYIAGFFSGQLNDFFDGT